jgi:hypothetical protein
VEASEGVGDTRTGLGDADIDGSSLATEAGFGAEVAGSESRADVAPKDESVGVAGSLGGKYTLEEVLAAVLDLKADLKASGSAVAEFSAGAIDSEGGAASDDEIFDGESSDLEWELELWRSGREANQVRFDRNGGAEMALPDVDRPEPVVATARVGMRDLVDFQAALPRGGGGEGLCQHPRATRQAAAMPAVWPTVWLVAGCQRLTKGGLRAEGIGLGRGPSRR